VQFFRNLFYPLFHAFVGQFWLTVFVDGQANKVIVIGQAFRRFKVIACSRPMANDSCAARLDDVADSAQRITEVFSIVFLVATAKQGDQFAIEIDLFQRREEIVPIALGFTVVPGWNAEQLDIVTFQITS
jgi:hypothetical protein